MDGQGLGPFPVINYAAYLAVSVGLTIWVARTLQKNGLVFLIDAFDGNEKLAQSVNHLLVVGFYLINIGYVTLSTAESVYPSNMTAVLELLTHKVGVVLIVLGCMHFGNLWIFNRMRKRGQLRHQPPPVLPTEFVSPPPQVFPQQVA